MKDSVALAKRLTQLSRYSPKLESLAHHIPRIMENNEQLLPLWRSWCDLDDLYDDPKKHFTKDEVRTLNAFFEYLYFASDLFLDSAKG